ncbi:fatty acid-binding protein, liver-like [Rhinatrema bivittatum]|uniref:fatty acid-binding protein, liver-like n=1 Tax=Rhinatrema bivittatum TaxID=194408 RepID=UPI0011295B01|nr:fatty acid-binding protein, liver-like [Rhinatrema bivittatum]
MPFNGTYKLESQKNFETLMERIGVPKDKLQNTKESTCEIIQNGKNFKITITTAGQSVTNEFTVGKEAEIKTLTGDTIKTVVQMDGEKKLIVNMKGLESVTEINGDMLINTMTLGDIKCERISKRV